MRHEAAEIHIHPTQVLSSLNTFLKLWNGGLHLFANGECKQGGGKVGQIDGCSGQGACTMFQCQVL